MEISAIIAIAIFLVTLFLMVKRPKRINLGVAAGIGAIASLLLGTVTLTDAATALGNIWDAALAFVGIVTLSVTLDAMGFFRWAALRIAKMAKGNGVRLYIYTALLTAAVSILFANDSAVLILTPIVMEMVRHLKMTKEGRLAYLFGAGLIADTAAMPLITSNPVNIVSADFFGYTFVQHMIFMVPVAITTIALSLGVVYLFFRKKIPKSYPQHVVELLIKHGERPMWLRTSIVTLVAIDVGYVIASYNGIPVSFVICAGAFFLFTLYATTYKREAVFAHEKTGAVYVLKKVNWDILIFMISIFLVVQGLRHVGAIDFYAALFTSALTLPSVLSVLVPSLIVTVSASAMNNWPMTMLGLLSVKQAIVTNGLSQAASTTLIFSNIIGNNLGPHFFPLGSLAILMWLATMKRKGLTVRFKDYLKVGSILSILEVVVASIVLWLEQTYLQLALSIPT
jgi:arsenical pump membrane protein